MLHERVHKSGRESRRKIKIEFDVPVRSLQLGVIGRADIVEFHLQSDDSWLPFPVEYKRGRPKKDNSDRVQLCAQAVCLEEMLDTGVPSGALYYGKRKRRIEVVFDQALRENTIATARQLHVLLGSRKTPPPKYTVGCDSCSFFSSCLPGVAGKKDKVAKYMEVSLRS